jgi:hypothetical protein
MEACTPLEGLVSVQHHIFLSYSRRDMRMMQRVRDDLRSNSFSVWTDEGIHPGTISWKEAIEKAIRGTGIMLVLLSPDANDSTWVQREIDYAEVQGIPVLPILVRGEPRDAIPFALAGAQFVDLRSHYDIGFKLLLQRCVRHLPPESLKTVPARPADTTIISFRMNRQRRGKWYAFFSVMLLPLFIVLGFFYVQRSNAQPNIVEASPAPTESTGGNVILRYNAQSLVVLNQSNSAVSLYGLSFELETGNQSWVFSADEWISQNLSSGRCVQVWDSRYSYLPDDAAPASECQSRVAYRSTHEVFWLGTDASFVISRYGQEIQRCPVLAPDSTETVDCVLDL